MNPRIKLKVEANLMDIEKCLHQSIQMFKIVSKEGSERIVDAQPGEMIPIKQGDMVFPIVIATPIPPKTLTPSIGNAVPAS